MCSPTITEVPLFGSPTIVQVPQDSPVVTTSSVLAASVSEVFSEDDVERMRAENTRTFNANLRRLVAESQTRQELLQEPNGPTRPVSVPSSPDLLYETASISVKRERKRVQEQRNEQTKRTAHATLDQLNRTEAERERLFSLAQRQSAQIKTQETHSQHQDTELQRQGNEIQRQTAHGKYQADEIRRQTTLVSEHRERIVSGYYDSNKAQVQVKKEAQDKIQKLQTRIDGFTHRTIDDD